MKKINYLFFILIFTSLFLSIYFYPLMPDKIATHWGVNGEVNGFMPKFFGMFLFPTLLILLSLLFYYLPKIDPLKKNLESFKKELNIFIFILFAFFISIQCFVFAWNLGYKYDIGIIVSLGIGIIFFYLGVLLKKTKRNFFIGIRTPWTLSNDIVWDKTHNLGGKLFMIAGVLSIFGIFLKGSAFYFILIPLLIIVLYTFGYSYYVYRKIKK